MVIPPLNNFKIKNWFKVCSSQGIYVSTRHWKSSLLLSHKDQLTNILVIMGVGKYIYILRHYSSSPPSSNFGTPFFLIFLLTPGREIRKWEKHVGFQQQSCTWLGDWGQVVWHRLCTAVFVCACQFADRRVYWVWALNASPKLLFIPIEWLLSRRK